MFETIHRIPYGRSIFVVFVLFVLGSSAEEIVLEFAEGETLSSMADDLLRFVLSAAVLVFFLSGYVAQRNQLRELRDQLASAKSGLAEFDDRSLKLANQYRQIMQNQFAAWQLTESEQDIVTLLLKGLSFREIADLRETREKTVRQQASSVYQKAGVTSRYELAAWFFDDFLDPQIELNRVR